MGIFDKNQLYVLIVLIGHSLVVGTADAGEIAKEPLLVTMRDGVTLETNVYRDPDIEEPLPVLLLRTVYDQEPFEKEARLMAAGGYITITQDCRGVFGSGGEKTDTWGQGPDGFDTVAWIREQPWCNGKVAMWGASFMGFVQWLAAHEGTQLDALAPTCSWILNETKLDYEKMDIPVQHVVGYYDFLGRGSILNFQQMQQRSATEHSRANQQLFLGPWTHATGVPKVEDVDFGEVAAMDPPYSGKPTENLKWFDRFLKGIGSDEPIEAVRYFSMGENVWQTAGRWPPEQSKLTPFYLRSGGNANTRRGDGRIEWSPPSTDSPADLFISDPADPVPTAPGRDDEYLMRFAVYDQQLAQDRQDVLVYTTAPLETPITFAGTLSAELFVLTDQPGANYVVKLIDVHPSGFTHALATGALNLGWNETRLPKVNLAPGEAHQIEIDMGHSAARIDAGHRLCVQIAGTNTPIHNPLDAEDFDEITSPQVIAQSLFHDPDRPSRVWLPLMENDRSTAQSPGSLGVTAAARD